jgi:MYXO-CTERM domain-containing protein
MTMGADRVTDLPEHLQPTSDARLIGWIGALAAAAAGAVWLNRRRRDGS